MPLILDDGAWEAREALRRFVIDYNDTHVDRIANLSCNVWLERGRMFPVTQVFVLDYYDLKAVDDEL